MKKPYEKRIPDDFRTSMFKDVKILHSFFKNRFEYKHNYKVSDYVLDGESSLLFYNLINNQYNGILYISISNSLRKELVLKKLEKSGINFIKIIHARPKDIICEHIKHIPTTKDDETNMVNIWSYEKLFLYLDTYSFQPDQKLVAIRKLYDYCDIERLRKLKELHSKTKRPISKAVVEYFKDKKNIRYKLRNKEDTKLVYSILKNTEKSSRVLFGGVAVENHVKEHYPNNFRSTKDIDFLASPGAVKDIRNTLKKGGFIIVSEKIGNWEKNQSISNMKINKLTSKLESKPEESNDYLVIDFDHKIEDSEIDELKQLGVVSYKENVGNILSPEGLVCCKLAAITSKGTSPSGKWRFRIVKDLVDISLLFKLVGINMEKLNVVFNELTRRRIVSINKEKFPVILNIVEKDVRFEDAWMELIERNGFIVDDFDTSKYLKEIFKVID